MGTSHSPTPQPSPLLSTHPEQFHYHLVEELSRSSSTIYERGFRISDDGTVREPIVGKIPVQRAASEYTKLERDQHLTSYLRSLWLEDGGQTDDGSPPNAKGPPPFFEPLHISTNGDGSFCLYLRTEADDVRTLGSLLDDESASLSLQEKLDIIIQICNALDFTHRMQITHRFLTPDSIVYSPKTKRIWMNEFEYASTGAQTAYESHVDSPLEQMDDDKFAVEQLIFLSPEIVGKSLDKSIDHRSDLYQLGMIMYKMLGRSYPYKGAPIKILHAIQAIHPPLLLNANGNLIPRCMIRAVDKLLAKDPDNRYQSAYGLKKDIQQCLTVLCRMLEGNDDSVPGKIEAIELDLGTYDISPILRSPKTLYGRESIVSRAKSLIDTVIDRVSKNTMGQSTSPPSGGCEFITVSGSAGMGKTAFVTEVMNQCRAPRIEGTACLFARGKFDFLSERGNPFSGLVNCLRTLIFQIMAMPHLERERKRLKEKVVPNEKLLVNLVPEAAILLGIDNVRDLEEVNATESRLRFQQAIINAFAAIADNKALVLFLDDVQWACSATFELLDVLASTFARTLVNVVVILAFRRDDGHPNFSRICELEQQLQRRRSSGVVSIELDSLPLKGVHDMVAYMVDYRENGEVTDDDIWEVARILSRKTRANPFFLLQLMSALQQDGALYFDWVRHHWKWNLELVEQTDLTDNVVSFLVDQLDNLPEEARHCLIVGACSGQTFSSDVVEHCVADIFLQRGTPEYVKKGMQIALSEGLVKDGLSENEYAFAHDHIQQAADALSDDDMKAKIYLSIGKYFMSEPGEKSAGTRLLMNDADFTSDKTKAARNVNVFAIADHMNPYIDTIDSSEERTRLRNVNRLAVNRSKETGDLENAARYAQAGIKLLPENAWTDQSLMEEAMFFYLARGECAFAIARSGSGNFDAPMQSIQQVIDNTNSSLARTIAYNAKVRMMVSLGSIEAAIDCGLVCLRESGIHIDMPISDEERDIHMNAAKRMMEKADVDQLMEVKKLQDPNIASIVELLTTLSNIAYMVDRNFHAWLLSKAVLLSFEHGFSPMSLWSIALFAGVCIGDQAPTLAYNIGNAAAALCRAYRVNAVTAKVFQAHALANIHRREHFRGCMPFLQESYTAASRVGQTWFQAGALTYMSVVEFLSGDNLQSVQRNCMSRLRIMEISKWWDVGSASLTALSRYCKALRDRTCSNGDVFDDPADMAGPRFREKEYLGSMSGNNPHRTSFWLWFRMMALYMLGENLSALEAAEACYRQLELIPKGIVYIPIIRLYHCLALVRHIKDLKKGINIDHRNLPSDLREVSSSLDRLDQIAQELCEYAKNGEINFKHCWLIVKAERAGLHGELEQALQCHQAALEHTKAHGFRQYEGLSYELQAELFAERGLFTMAFPLFLQAAESYKDWGAEQKAYLLQVQTKGFMPPPSIVNLPLSSYTFSRSAVPAISVNMPLPQVEDGNRMLGLPISDRRGTTTSISSRTSSNSIPVSNFGRPSFAGFIGNSVVGEIMGPSGTIHVTALNSYDLSSVLAAVQMLSSEIHLPRLLRRMMALIAENSGATKGALILADHGTHELAVECQFDATKQDDIIASHEVEAYAEKTGSPTEGHNATMNSTRKLLQDVNDLSVRVITYVARTMQPLMLADATQELITADDPHIVQMGVKSILALPILRRDKGLVGVLYLENENIQGAFSAKSVQVLTLLSSQIAISVEHAILFRNVQQARRISEESDRRNRLMLECIPQLVWTTDKEGAVTFLNKRWAEHTGRSLENLLGVGWLMSVHPDDRRSTYASWSRAVNAVDQTFAVEYRLQAADGSYRWFVSRGTPLIKMEDGQEIVDLWLGTTTDIQDQKEAKEWKRIERELRETREAALNTAKMKSQFLANMSHELRTPFSGVLGMINLLTETPLNEEQVEYVYTAKQSCENLLFVIDGILDYSKLEAGMVNQEKIPSDIEAVVEQTCDLLVTLSTDKGIELYSHATTPVPMVEADPHLIRQVLLNLVGNAIKFTHEGEVRVQLGVIQEDDDSVVVRFEVKDTGIGLTQSELEVLYKPFSQVDGSTTRIYGGTGLGLSICKGIVNIMEGTIGVESQKGKGSTFWFTARFRKLSELTPTPGNLSVAAAAGPAGISTDPEIRVLLVADSPWKATALSHFQTVMNEPTTMDLQTFIRDVVSNMEEPLDYGLIVIDLNDHDALVGALRLLDSAAVRINGSADKEPGNKPGSGPNALVLITPKIAKALTAWQPTPDDGVKVVKLTKPLTRRKLLKATAELDIVDASKVGTKVAAVRSAEGSGIVASPQANVVTMQSGGDSKIKAKSALASSSSLKMSPRILIAEDNEIAAKVSIKTIEKLQVPRSQIVWAKDGKEAVDQYQKSLEGHCVKFDLIFMDLHMPRLDGFGATREIRRLEQESGVTPIPILGLTADIQVSAKENCLKNGMNDYLVKPCSKPNLAAAINRWG